MNRNTSISIGDYFDNFIQSRISAGRYKNASEVVRAVKSLIATKATFNGNYISAKKKVMGRKLDLLFNSLVEQINSLYGITSEELNTVLNDEELNNEPKED